MMTASTQKELFTIPIITSDLVEKELDKVRSIPPLTALLQFVGYTGIATGVQLLRFLKRDHSEKSSLEIIAYAIDKRYLRPFTLPGKEKKTPQIFYLTDRGFKRIQYLDKELAECCRYGVPDQKRMSQVVHDLITMGSILDWRERYEVLWFMSDRQMRSDRMRQRWLHWKHSYGGHLPSEAIGDYRICLYRFADGEIEMHECEAAVKYKVEAIASKPNHMKWFTNNEYQQRKIAAVKATKAKLIDPFAVLPEEEQAARFIREATGFGKTRLDERGLSRLDNQILELFRSTQIIFSANNLLKLLPEKYRAVNHSLSKLEAAGSLKSLQSKPLFGTGRGRPEKFFYLADNEGLLEEFNAVQRHIILSFVFCTGTKQKNWRLISFDKNIPALTVEADGGIPVTFISDHADGEPTDVCVRTVVDFHRFKKESLHKLFLVVLDLDRRNQLLKEIPKENLYDLTNHFLMIKKRSWTSVL